MPYDPLRSFANEVLPLHVIPELIHINDVVRHPLFPGHPLYVVGREVDLISRSATMALDPLSSETEESPFPFTPNILDD